MSKKSQNVSKRCSSFCNDCQKCQKMSKMSKCQKMSKKFKNIVKKLNCQYGVGGVGLGRGERGEVGRKRMKRETSRKKRRIRRRKRRERRRKRRKRWRKRRRRWRGGRRYIEKVWFTHWKHFHQELFYLHMFYILHVF